MNTPKYLIVHHTGGTDANPLADTSNQSFEIVNEYHRQKWNFRSSLGFFIGYHYYIDKAGKLTQGRDDTDEGAHTVGKNKESLGICLAGNFDATLPTKEQENTLRDLLNKKMRDYGIPLENIVPHRKFASKTCFGRNLPDNWAQSILSLSREDRIIKASKLLAEAVELLKGII